MSCEMFPQGEYLLHRNPFNSQAFKGLVEIDLDDVLDDVRIANITPAEVFQIYESILTKYGEPIETTTPQVEFAKMPYARLNKRRWWHQMHQTFEGFQCPKIVFWTAGNLDTQHIDLGRLVPKEDPPIRDITLLLENLYGAYKDGSVLSVFYEIDPDRIMVYYTAIDNLSICRQEELVQGNKRLKDLVDFAKFLENTFKKPKTIGLVRAVYNTSRMSQILAILAKEKFTRKDSD